MKHTLPMIATLLLSPLVVLQAADAPKPDKRPNVITLPVRCRTGSIQR